MSKILNPYLQAAGELPNQRLDQNRVIYNQISSSDIRIDHAADFFRTYPGIGKTDTMPPHAMHVYLIDRFISSLVKDANIDQIQNIGKKPGESVQRGEYEYIFQENGVSINVVEGGSPLGTIERVVQLSQQNTTELVWMETYGKNLANRYKRRKDLVTKLVGTDDVTPVLSFIEGKTDRIVKNYLETDRKGIALVHSMGSDELHSWAEAIMRKL